FVAPTHAPPTYIFARSPIGLVVMRYSQRAAPYSSGECGARVSTSLKVKPSTARSLRHGQARAGLRHRLPARRDAVGTAQRPDDANSLIAQGRLERTECGLEIVPKCQPAQDRKVQVGPRSCKGSQVRHEEGHGLLVMLVVRGQQRSLGIDVTAGN